MIISFYIVPVGDGTSISKYLIEVSRYLKEKNVKFIMTPASTIIEAENVGEGLRLVGEVHEKVMEMGVSRMITVVKVDDRRDKELSLESMEKKIKEIIRG